MKSKIEALKDHYILCGFGRVGTEIAREFSARSVPFVIVESNPEAIGRAQAGGYLLLEADAAHRQPFTWAHPLWVEGVLQRW
jgi:voltage-gated potassium channel